ncbi:hypothetical protein P7K49_023880, partial [Saguinus oedipus]
MGRKIQIQVLGLLTAGAQFPARPPDRARLSRAGLALRLCGRQMVSETAASRA